MELPIQVKLGEGREPGLQGRRAQTLVWGSSEGRGLIRALGVIQGSHLWPLLHE